ncbi:MAG: chemotaxis protein CheW [bacterium]
MDLLKARERARKKAQQQKQEKAEEERAPSSSSQGSGRSPEEQEASRSVPPSAPEAAEEPEAASAADSVREGPEDKPAAEDTGKSEDSAFVSMSDFSEEDVFCDDSFGEELPSFPEQKGGGQEVPDASILLDDDDAGGGEEKTAQKKDKNKEDQESLERSAAGERDKSRPSGEQAVVAEDTSDSMDWEVREHMTPEKQKPEPAEASPLPEEEPPAADEPSLEGEYSLEDMATDEDDFFSLVTEELYMREFGAEGAEAEDQFSLLSFRLAQETYAVRLTSIRQIIKVVPVTMVPRVPDYVLGIISLRGTVIPVFDLRRILKLPEAEATRKSRIIIVNHGKYTAGLLVDQVEQVVRMSESAIEPPPPVLGGVEAEYIKGIGRVDSKMVIFLALEKIMVPVG